MLVSWSQCDRYKKRIDTHVCVLPTES